MIILKESEWEPDAAVAKECVRCGQAFTVPGVFLAKIVLNCPACYDAHQHEEAARAEAERQAARRAAWETICPPEFRATDPAQLPERATHVLLTEFSRRKTKSRWSEPIRSRSSHAVVSGPLVLDPIMK